jgi:hypothetical protein
MPARIEVDTADETVNGSEEETVNVELRRIRAYFELKMPASS